MAWRVFVVVCSAKKEVHLMFAAISHRDPLDLIDELCVQRHL
jgi:hypothetical protein